MPEHRESILPASLVLVATLFIVHGTTAVIEMIIAWSRDTSSINFGAVNLIIGFGLLMGFPWARLMAMVMTSLVAILVLVFAAMVVNGAPATLDWFGSASAIEVPGWLVVALGAIILAIAAWQLEVLMRPSIAKLFSQSKTEHRPLEFCGNVGRHD